MSDFLVRWDAALSLARRYGDCEWMWKSWVDEDGNYNLKPVGRTMHPSFMAVPVPKHDPLRDGKKRSIQHGPERDQ